MKNTQLQQTPQKKLINYLLVTFYLEQHAWLFNNIFTKSINRQGLVSRLHQTLHHIAIVVGARHLPLGSGLVNILSE